MPLFFSVDLQHWGTGAVSSSHHPSWYERQLHIADVQNVCFGCCGAAANPTSMINRATLATSLYRKRRKSLIEIHIIITNAQTHIANRFHVLQPMKRGHETIQTGWHFLSVYLGLGAPIFWKGVAISPCQILANDYHDFRLCATNGAMLCVVWVRNLPQSVPKWTIKG